LKSICRADKYSFAGLAEAIKIVYFESMKVGQVPDLTDVNPKTRNTSVIPLQGTLELFGGGEDPLCPGRAARRAEDRRARWCGSWGVSARLTLGLDG